MDNTEKQGTQHDDIENKNRTQYMMDTTMRKETQITLIKHESFIQPLKKNFCSRVFICLLHLLIFC
jgi:hypothetical protein